MNKAVLLLALSFALPASAEKLWVLRDSVQVEYITPPTSYKVGQCIVTDYETSAGERHIAVSAEQDGIKDVFNFTAWLNRRGELQTRSYRVWIGSKDPTKGPYLIGNCPLYTAVNLPREIQELGCIPDPP